MKVDFTKTLENTNGRLVFFKERTRTFFKSRWSGLVLGPLYGLFMYLYFTYMIFSGPPFTPNPQSLNVVNGNTSTNLTECQRSTTKQHQTIEDQGCIIDDLINSIGINGTIRNLTIGSHGNDSEPKYVTNLYIECTTFDYKYFLEINSA